MNKNVEALDESKQALRNMKETLKAGGSDVVEEARAAAGDVRSAASDSADSIRKAGGLVGQHARSAAGSVKVALGDAADSAGDAAHALVDYQRGTLRDWRVRAEDYVRAKPAPAFAVAVAAGLIVGLWLRGSRR